MTDAKTLTRIERLVWVLIYAGLFLVVLGVASLSEAPATGWSLLVIGGCVAAAGVVLIWVRSRLGGSG